MNINITLPENTPAREELMNAIIEELKELEIGDVNEIQDEREKAELEIDPETVLIIIKIVHWSIKAVKAAIEIINEKWEQHKVNKNVDMGKSKIDFIIKTKTDHKISLPASESKINKVLNEIEDEEE